MQYHQWPPKHFCQREENSVDRDLEIDNIEHNFVPDPGTEFHHNRFRRSFQTSWQGFNVLLKDAPAPVIPLIFSSNTSEYHRHHVCRETPRTSDVGDITQGPFYEHSLGLNYRSASGRRYEKVAPADYVHNRWNYLTMCYT